VAAVRESSVVMAAAALAIGGREEMGPARFAGAVVVVAGIALISLG
jgi:drug/metabolite transporter (DMT)-like permease